MKFGYFKGHNSITTEVKHGKFEIGLYLFVPNNISKFLIIPFMLSKVIDQETSNLMKFVYFKGHNSGTTEVKHAKFKLGPFLLVSNNISKFQIIPFMITKLIDRKPCLGRTYEGNT